MKMITDYDDDYFKFHYTVITLYSITLVIIIWSHEDWFIGKYIIL